MEETPFLQWELTLKKAWGQLNALYIEKII